MEQGERSALCGPAEAAITRTAEHLGVDPIELARWLNTDHTLEQALRGLARAVGFDNLSSEERALLGRTAESFAEFLFEESERSVGRVQNRIRGAQDRQG